MMRRHCSEGLLVGVGCYGWLLVAGCWSLPLLPRSAEAGGYVRQRQYDIEVVVGCDAAVALEAATQAAVDDAMLALRPRECGERFHEAAAVARAVARRAIVDVTRVEADGAVVALASAGRRQADHGAAAAAAEFVAVAGVRIAV